MIENSKKDRPIGRKLQLLLIIPLILAVIICSVIVIAAVFITQQDWVSDTEKMIQDQEKKFLENYVLAVRDTLEVSIVRYSTFLNLFCELYKMQEANEIQASSSLQKAKFKSAYSSFDDTYPNTSSAEWVSGTSDSAGPDPEMMQVPDAFLRTYYFSRKPFVQAGYLTNEDQDLLYLYPVENMSFLQETFNYSKTCQIVESGYRPACTEAFQYLFGENMFYLIYYENNRLYLMQDFSDGFMQRASVLVLPQKFFIQKLLTGTKYTTFSCNSQGKWTLAVSDSDLEDFTGDNREISAALFKDNDNAREDFRELILDRFDEGKASDIVAIDSKETFFAFNLMNISINNRSELNYTVCSYRSKSDVFKTWNEFNDEVLIIMIIQACIYAGFLIITSIIAWRLALVIDHRVANPIESLSGYMKAGNPTLYMIQNSFNSHLNSMLENLRNIETIEKMINPEFLLNPVVEDQIKNLETVCSLFKSIDNKRGLAIALNVLGNIKFLAKKPKEAEENYREALSVLKQLRKELKTQELKEENLGEKDKKKLGTQNVFDFWEDKKKMVRESIKDQRLQIVLALTSKIKESGSGSFPAHRKKWKEIISLQTKALQFYIDSKENCADYLELLINLAEVYQLLNYFHTSEKLLEIVKLELHSLNMNPQSKIDVDSRRLRKIGLSIKESRTIELFGRTKEHFAVNPERFQLDVIAQKLYYVKGKLNLDKENYHRAAKDFQQAIVLGTYFDPDIRKNSIKELYSLLRRFKLEMLSNDLEVLYNQYSEPKTNYVIVLAFDLNLEEELAAFVVQFAQNLTDENSRLAAVSKNNVNQHLELIERDFPGLDMENLIIQSKTSNDKEHLFDSLGRAADLLNSLESYQEDKSFLIIFFKQSKEITNMLTLKILESKLGKKIKIIFVRFGDILSLDFEIFIEDLEGETIAVDENSLDSCEGDIKSLMEVFK